MKRYVIVFGLANVVLLIVLALVAQLLKLRIGTSLAVTSSGASAIIAGGLFFRDYDRAPSSEEKSSFAWGALATTWLVSVLLAGAVLPFLMKAGDLKRFFSLFSSWGAASYAACAVLVVSTIHYFALRWMFGVYAKISAGKRPSPLPNPSIERTSPGKPGLASHVKR